jgi:hypothetical protein
VVINEFDVIDGSDALIDGSDAVINEFDVINGLDWLQLMDLHPDTFCLAHDTQLANFHHQLHQNVTCWHAETL